MPDKPTFEEAIVDANFEKLARSFAALLIAGRTTCSFAEIKPPGSPGAVGAILCVSGSQFSPADAARLQSFVDDFTRRGTGRNRREREAFLEEKPKGGVQN